MAASDVALQAAINGNLILLKMMASKVSLREAKDDKGRNALHLAAEKGHLEVCRFLVEDSGLGVDSVSAEGRRPVHAVASGGSESVLRYLLDRGGDPAMPDSRGVTPLHVAAEEGHCEAVRLLLSKGVDVDAINFHGTPLHMAASKGRDQALKILLEHGADPNKVVHQFFTPLLLACLGCSLKCMKLLVEEGADVNFVSPRGPIVLMEAVNHGLTDIVKFLLEAGADPNIPDEHGRTVIIWAAVHGKRELVELLFPRTKPMRCLPDWSVDGIIRTMKLQFHDKVSQGALLERELLVDPKSRGNEAFAKRDYTTAVYLYGLAAKKDPLDATLYANLSICWLRLGNGEEALSNARKCKIMRPGWSKAWYPEGAALSFLKNYKGAVDAFKQALILDPSNDEIKKALSDGEQGEPARSQGREGEEHAPLGRGEGPPGGLQVPGGGIGARCRLRLCERCVRLTENLRFSCRMNSRSATTLPMRFNPCRPATDPGAAVGGSESVLRYLLDRGADPGAAVGVLPDSKGLTPLHIAAVQGHCEAVRLLLCKGVDVDAISSCGTPLHMAASKDQDQALKILLDHGADSNKVFNQSVTPLLLASCGAHSLKCTKLLVEAGADVNFMSPGGAIILMVAVDDGSTDIVKFLLEAGADPNIPDKDGRIPITWAALHGQRDLVELLFPRTKPIPHMPDWSVDGIIRSMKLLSFDAKGAFLEKELLADPKSRAKEAFADGNYFEALYLYGLAAQKGPLDATLYANLSICWLRLGEGEEALSDARKCKMMRPGWSKAWYREGAALSFLKNYKGAVDTFSQALKLDPSNDEIKKALREATEAMRSAARSG